MHAHACACTHARTHGSASQASHLLTRVDLGARARAKRKNKKKGKKKKKKKRKKGVMDLHFLPTTPALTTY
jgi:hypothetical protein